MSLAFCLSRGWGTFVYNQLKVAYCILGSHFMLKVMGQVKLETLRSISYCLQGQKTSNIQTEGMLLGIAGRFS